MTRSLTALVVVVLAAVVAAPVVGPAVVTADTPTATTADGGGTVQPGDQLQGVVGVQGAEIAGDIEERAFGVAFATADTNASKAATVSAQVSDLEQRIGRLENRKDELRAARENGSIDDSEFRARMAVLVAEAATARRLANGTANATRRLPAAALEDRGVDPASVRSLGRRASNLTGPETAAIARSIAGNGVGRRVAGRNRPNVTGPPPGVPGGPPGRGNGTAGPPGRGNGTAGPPERDNGTAGPPGGGPGGPPSGVDYGAPSGVFGHGYGAEAGTFRDRSAAPGPLAVTESGEGVPLFTVGLRSTEPARVTLRLTFDLTTDADRRAFETLQDDEDARIDVRNRFRNRMQSVADNAERRVDRNMTVSDPGIGLSTSADGDTGIVTLSVAWTDLAGRAGGDPPNLVITEPFASGFTPSREFTVRILAPDNYRLTRANPEPMAQTERSASWAAGTSLNEFLLEFAPDDGTPLPSDALEEFDPASPTPGTSDGGGPSGAALTVGGLLALAIAAGGYLAWRRREEG